MIKRSLARDKVEVITQSIDLTAQLISNIELCSRSIDKPLKDESTKVLGDLLVNLQMALDELSGSLLYNAEITGDSDEDYELNLICR